MEDTQDAEEVGVAVALEKICALESRLRQAIQSTHSLHRSFGRDMVAVDREREALLLIREHLELLEDNLREFRTVAADPHSHDEKAIALSQLDSLRKDLLRTAKDKVDCVLYNKDVVKDILAFADSGSGEEPLPDKTIEFESLQPNGAMSPESPLPSSEEHEFHSPAHREAAHLQPPGNVAGSPNGARKELQVHTGDSCDSLFPFPVQASTPSMRVPLSRDAKKGAVKPLGGPSQEKDGLAMFQRPPRPNGGWIGANKGKPPSSYDSFVPSERSTPRPPSSFVGSCDSPNGGYHIRAADGFEQGFDDSSFGGKVSVTVFKDRDKTQVEKPAPSTSGTGSDHPRIVHDPSYADEQSRMLASREDSNSQSGGGASKSPIRKALQRRAAASQIQHTRPSRSRQKHVLRFLSSCIKLAMAGAVGTVTAVSISKAVKPFKFAPLAALPLPRTHAEAGGPSAARQRKFGRRSSGTPRADGHLVPDWMHRSRFKSTEWPPTGALTSTAEPPGGEMFPVIPPPQGEHIKG